MNVELEMDEWAAVLVLLTANGLKGVFDADPERRALVRAVADAIPKITRQLQAQAEEMCDSANSDMGVGRDNDEKN